jgi:acetylornithine deacetylase/succinyl-diaminopimelate desuccinylase-like protein
VSAEIDGARILREARELAFPRYPGTPGDRRAIALVADKLRETGLEVVEEPFSYDIRPAFRAIRLALLGSALLVALAGLLAGPWPVTSLVLLGLGVVPGALLLAWSPWAEKVYARPGPTETANVVGKRPVERPRRTLVLMAHHDSKAQNLTFPWRMGMTLTALAGVAGLAAVLVIRSAGATPLGPPWIAAALGGAAAVALAVLSTLRSMDGSPGGVDNAGSLATLIELARVLPSRVPDDVELLFLSTGAEEDHMVGAMRWLDRHVAALEGRPLHALNFDGAGSPGRAVMIERFGFGRVFSRELSAVARRVARRLGIPVRGIWMPPAIGIDAIPFAHRGVPCLTFSSGSLGRATLAVHSPRDVADHLDAETLERVARLGAETAVAVASASKHQ